ncbi:hypothetical protein DLJ53_24240 [Acuticoccus sediminis]|uniref:Uncharacterized protein n=1 Tax=Acuticoccus sediminis TaxID=2184697 RepID=A0A8B2NLR2_9HYPH|nr:hypothetical protein [Acuticoccus sediminis]RAH98754.1 hypothetical protein DLJ53_24240 [Acuticoccus sediminis]
MRAIVTVLGLSLLLAGCVTGGSGSSIDGNWSSDDGVFIANFNNGAFTSRLTGTGETVVADGRYARSPDGITLSWTSIAANESRAAKCVFVTTRQLSCAPSVGQPFTMTRVR